MRVLGQSTDAPAYLKTIEVGQHAIENDNVYPLGEQDFECISASVGRACEHALVLELGAKNLDQHAIIIYD